MKLLHRRLVLVKQHDETDCAAACLATIAKYYGKQVSLSRIRYFSGTDCFGTTGYGLVKGAEVLGMSCRGLFSEKRVLVKNVPFPLICHIKKEIIDHYVVVYGVQNDKIIIADPEKGIEKLCLEDFEKSWSGVYFVVLPEQKFSRTKETKGIYSRFLYLLIPYKKTVAECFLAGIILSILGAAGAFYYRFLIDDILYSSLKNTLTLCSFAYLFVILFKTLTSFSRNQLMNYMSNKIDLMLVTDYFRHILNLPMHFFTSRKTGEIIRRIEDSQTVRHTISSTTLSVVIDSCMVAVGGIFLFLFGAKLLPVAVVPVIISAFIAGCFIKPFRKKIKNLCVLEAEKQSVLVESVNGISTIKALSSENEVFTRAEGKIVNCVRKSIKLGSMANILECIQSFVSECGTLLLYWYGSGLILKGELSLGQLISFVTLSGYFLGPLGRLMNLQQSFQEASIASDRLSEILDMPEECENEEKTVEIETIKDEIVVKNVSFSYGTREPALKNISFTIKKGEKVAFVGSSGSGKSTMTKLLMKFYNIERGDIFVDGISLSDVNTKSWRNLTGYVPQEVLLFSGSVMDNIRFGSDVFSLNKIVEAAISADAHDFIQRLDCRYNTTVGEKGASLSGGERQRISLARAFLKNPQILILDEATSSLDSISEKEVLGTVEKLAENCTTIIVAHKLSSIKNCDRIFVFDKGEIVENGSHEELLLKKGKYSEMWNAQNNF